MKKRHLWPGGIALAILAGFCALLVVAATHEVEPTCQPVVVEYPDGRRVDERQCGDWIIMDKKGGSE